MDHLVHSLDPISLARKNFQPQTQNSDDETILADGTYYVWGSEWFNQSIIIIPPDISSHTITTISINRDYVRITLYH